MSGGVDSSVAAYLLKSQGYDVIGVTMQGGCCGQSAVDDARRVCDVIGIPYYVMSFRDVFQKNVIDYFVNEYISGRTPNPCIACNRYVKWEALLKKAREIGADYIATGHYARILRLVIQADAGSACAYADAGRRLLQGRCQEDCEGTGPSGRCKTGQRGDLFCRG